MYLVLEVPSESYYSRILYNTLTMSTKLTTDGNNFQPQFYNDLELIPSFWRKGQINNNDIQTLVLHPYFFTLKGTLKEKDSPYMAFYLDNGIRGYTEENGENIGNLV